MLAVAAMELNNTVVVYICKNENHEIIYRVFRVGKGFGGGVDYMHCLVASIGKFVFCIGVYSVLEIRIQRTLDRALGKRWLDGYFLFAYRARIGA